MEVITKNADAEIKNLVEIMSHQPVAWRSVHFLWKDIPEFKLHDMAGLLQKHDEDHDCHLFKWGKEDIFLMVKGGKIEFLDHLKNIISTYHKNSFSEKGSDTPKIDIKIHDMSVDWSKFENFFKEREREVISQRLNTEAESEIIDFGSIKWIREQFSKAQDTFTRRATRPGTVALIIGNDKDSVNSIAKMLKGYSILTSYNAEDGMERYFEEAPDIIFIDNSLSEIDSWDLIKYLHEVDSKAYVIVLASSGQADDVHKAIKLGVKGYLRKPYSFDNMEQYLKKYHSQAPSHKRVYAE